MKPEKQQLIRDLLGDDGRREATLLAGTKMLGRRRLWRTAKRGLGLMAVAVATVWLVGRQDPSPRPFQISKTEIKPPAAVQVKFLTDDELLSLFPDTPVGLITLPNGKKRLIFPHPEDEKRFIIRI